MEVALRFLLSTDPFQFLVSYSGASRNGRLRVAYINVRSLVPHVVLVRDIIAFHRLDILAVKETWLRNSTDSGFVDIDNYVLVCSDREDPRTAAGVVCYISMILFNSPRSAWAFRRWILLLTLLLYLSISLAIGG